MATSSEAAPARPGEGRSVLGRAARVGRIGLRYVPVLLRGRPVLDERRYNPFFIIGAGRSGTTLLRAVLLTSPEVHIPPETYVLGNLIREYRRYSRLPWDAVIRLTLSRLAFADHFDTHDLSLRHLYYELEEVPREELDLAYILHRFYMYSAEKHKPSATRWGDKTPLNTNYLPELHSVFPDARYIHLIRDGRDVARSLTKMGIFTHREAAELWRKRVRLSREFQRLHPGSVLEVRYEDLAADPEPQIRRVCDFIGLPFDERMLRHHEVDQSLGDADKHAYHEHVREPITVNAVGKWKEFFSADELGEVEAVIGEDLERLGYGR